MSIIIGIVVVSDRAAQGEYEDRGGPAVSAWLEGHVKSAFTTQTRIVPDEPDQLAAAIRALVDEAGCDLRRTTGGTGPAPRDITPEGTEQCCDRLLPGFGEAMRAASAAFVPTAMLSRQVAGHRGRCLIVNLPGKPKAVGECLDAIVQAVPWCIELLGGPVIETDPPAFRPRAASSE